MQVRSHMSGEDPEECQQKMQVEGNSLRPAGGSGSTKPRSTRKINNPLTLPTGKIITEHMIFSTGHRAEFSESPHRCVIKKKKRSAIRNNRFHHSSDGGRFKSKRLHRTWESVRICLKNTHVHSHGQAPHMLQHTTRLCSEDGVLHTHTHTRTHAHAHTRMYTHFHLGGYCLTGYRPEDSRKPQDFTLG